MIARMNSLELTKWMALFTIHERERQREKDIAESGDGIVFDPRADDENEEDDDGEPE